MPMFERCSNEIPTAHVAAARRRCGRRAHSGPPRSRADRPTAATRLSDRCAQGGASAFLENDSRGVQSRRARGNRSRRGGQAASVLRALRRAPRRGQAEAYANQARILLERSTDLTETARALCSRRFSTTDYGSGASAGSSRRRQTARARARRSAGSTPKQPQTSPPRRATLSHG